MVSRTFSSTQPRLSCVYEFYCRCVLELYAIVSKMKSGGGRFEIAMTAAERKRFLDESKTKYGPADAQKMIQCSVSVERSECSRESDRQSIHSAIQETVGFDHLNCVIIEVIERWMFRQLDQNSETQDEEEAHSSKAQIAAMLCDQGRYDEAILLEEQILAYTKRTCPSGHVSIAIAMTNLAISYRNSKRFHDALALHFEALDIYQSQLKPEHPQYRYIGREYGNMGACYQGMDCPSDCLRLHKQALQWRRQHLPPDDEEIGTALFSVAAAYLVGQQFEQSAQWGADALEFRRRVLPANHPILSENLVNLSLALNQCNRHAEAISAVDEAVALLKRVRASDRPDLAFALRVQSHIHAAAAQRDPAVRL